MLTPAGYRVIQAADPEQTLEQARGHRPDAIIIDVGLPGPDGYRVCRALRADAAIAFTIPIVLTTAGRATRAQQLDALRAGAWELRGAPLDSEEFLLRLAVYVQVKRDADRLGAEGLVDPASGLYNADGMTRRSQELAALSTRQGLALACAVFKPADPFPDGPAGDRLARVFKASARISDAVCRTGPDEFTVFAPATDALGAATLVRRLANTVARGFEEPVPAAGQPVALRAGYSAAAAEPGVTVDPLDLLARARAALGASERGPQAPSR